MPQPSRLGIGLVGVGGFGEFCLKAFSAMPEVRIAAVADIDPARAQKAAREYDATAYQSLDALLADPAVQIVALNTPPFLHSSQGLACLTAGKHLFCEKPLALTVDEGRALIDAAAANHVLLTVDYVMRHNPFWAAAASLARSGVLGALRHMDLANHAAGVNLPATHWFWDPAKSGGIWIEHGVHFFDAFSWVAGLPGKVLHDQSYQRSDGATDRVEALLRYGDTAAHFYHGFDQSSQTEQTTVTLTFERGYVTLREWVPTALDVLTTVTDANWASLLSGTVTRSEAADGRTLLRSYAPEGKSALYTRCIQDGMRNLAQAITKPEVTLLVTGEDALASLAIAALTSQ